MLVVWLRRMGTICRSQTTSGLHGGHKRKREWGANINRTGKASLL
jgi:hypothetical protein